MKSQRTKALDISPNVKQIVWERDKWCVLCGSSYGMPNAHYIPRSKGGLGIEENIVTLCAPCHRDLDQTTERPQLLKQVKEHLEKHYPNFKDSDRIYKKGEF